MTVDLSNRIIQDDGTVIFNRYGLLEMLYCGYDLDSCICDNKAEIEQFKIANKICDTQFSEPKNIDSVSQHNISWTNHWFTPSEYLDIDVRNWCHEKCQSNEEHRRVDLEMDELEKRNMILFFLLQPVQ